MLIGPVERRPARPLLRRVHHNSSCAARFDETRRQQALSFAAALFVIGFAAPGAPASLFLRPEGSSMVGAILGLTARPLLESLMHLASSVRQDALAILRSWISRRWE